MVERGDPGVDAELLREITEDFADLVFVGEDVEAVELDGAGVGVLEGGDGAHEGALAGAVGAEEAEHVVADVQREILERLYAVGVGLGKTSDRKCQSRDSSGWEIGMFFEMRNNVPHAGMPLSSLCDGRAIFAAGLWEVSH